MDKLGYDCTLDGDHVTLWLDDDEVVKVSVPAAVLEGANR